jgi:hypothetical protein
MFNNDKMYSGKIYSNVHTYYKVKYLNVCDAHIIHILTEPLNNLNIYLVMYYLFLLYFTPSYKHNEKDLREVITLVHLFILIFSYV